MSFPDFDLPMNLKNVWIEAVNFLGINNIAKDFHSHSFYEVHFVLSGSITYFLDDKQIKIEEGNAIFIPANKVHKFFSSSEDVFKIAIAFLVDSNFLSETKIFEFNEEIIKIFNKIFVLCQENNIFTNHIIGLKITEILYSLFESFSIHLPKSTEVKQDSRFLAAKSFIENNFQTKITTSQVANECCLSPKQMNRIFIKETGKNISNYINLVKIKNAKKLLLESDLSIKEICFVLGFENEGSFISFFKKHCGVTPGAFRKNVQ